MIYLFRLKVNEVSYFNFRLIHRLLTKIERGKRRHILFPQVFIRRQYLFLIKWQVYLIVYIHARHHGLTHLALTIFEFLFTIAKFIKFLIYLFLLLFLLSI